MNLSLEESPRYHNSLPTMEDVFPVRLDDSPEGLDQEHTAGRRRANDAMTQEISLDLHHFSSSQHCNCSSSSSSSGLAAEHCSSKSSKRKELDTAGCVESKEEPCATPEEGQGRKSVLFHDTVRVREHAVTVGDAALSMESCPITLCWSYTEYSSPTALHHEERQKAYKTRFPAVKRLDLNQRRERIAQVQGWNREQVRALEIELLLERMDEAMSRQEALENQKAFKMRQIEDETKKEPKNWPRLLAAQSYPFSERSESLFRSRNKWLPVMNGVRSGELVATISQRLEMAVAEWASEVSQTSRH